MDLWSLWCSLWPILLLITLVSGIANLVWAFGVCVKNFYRPWLPIAMAAAIMSAFTFSIVIANFPDA